MNNSDKYKLPQIYRKVPFIDWNPLGHRTPLNFRAKWVRFQDERGEIRSERGEIQSEK